MHDSTNRKPIPQWISGMASEYLMIPGNVATLAGAGWHPLRGSCRVHRKENNGQVHVSPGVNPTGTSHSYSPTRDIPLIIFHLHIKEYVQYIGGILFKNSKSRVPNTFDFCSSPVFGGVEGSPVSVAVNLFPVSKTANDENTSPSTSDTYRTSERKSIIRSSGLPDSTEIVRCTVPGSVRPYIIIIMACSF